uniref:Uncharacterized protein n=1 Tax=Candidatus Kentrum sp. FM TaxID=2126340 RepID=A0A450TT75_9GAMM|nr:MAG: hypothetical protein BECKFM1743C_GA0114222_105994 [Candidatus Kentron sp. FM]VFJ71658.1 MAG: hypothetical protein BECKFM1743A_GA0114220_105994 [Candidatus Kentron sp. FM]VFK19623.1 MAG: hypothetical protein BECKFM1743B_GA0114221_106334 [Candidatus Kentron sp. FM]
MNDEDTLRAEYPSKLIESGERGKYVERYREGVNVILVDPDLHRLFPDSASVNHALRKYAEDHGVSLA